MSDIKPIETIYNGYRFRSRLEARWAVFFDNMDIRYRYEHEGFERSFGPGEPTLRYLPDFWFPDYDVFGEVKGTSHLGGIPKEDAEKMSWMIDFNGPCKNGIVLLGDIPNPDGAIEMSWAFWVWNGKGITLGYKLGEMPQGGFCGLDVVIENESAPRSFSKNNNLVLSTSINGGGPKGPKYKVEKALIAARSARFEYGETPKLTDLPFC